MSEELKPCPFCGGQAKRVDIEEGENAGGSCIVCTRCLASGNVEFGRKENFVSNWNSRAALKDRDVVLEEAAKVAGEYHSKWSGAGGFEGHTAAARIIAQAIRNLKERV